VTYFYLVYVARVIPKKFLASCFQLLPANKRDEKSIKLNNIVVHFSLSLLPNIVAHFNLYLLPGPTRPNQSYPHINLTRPKPGTNSHRHHETHTTRRRAQIWWCEVAGSQSGHAAEDDSRSVAKESFSSPVARPRELDIRSPRRPPERPLSSASAANACLGVQFSAHKLSRRLEHAYPLRGSRRIPFNT
jgi:hypothetical protein